MPRPAGNPPSSLDVPPWDESSPALDAIHPMDCIQGMRLLPRGSIDIIVTSPPYNLGKPYAGYDDRRPRQEYLDWMGGVAGEAKRVLRDQGSFFLNVGGSPGDPWIPLDVAQRFREHFVLQNVIHWVKSIAIPRADTGRYDILSDDLSAGHYQPVNSPRYLSGCHEYLFHFTRHGTVPLDKLAVGVKYQDKSNIGRWRAATRDLRDRGNTWFIPYRTIRSARPHPTTFPERLPEMCIRLHGYTPATVVLDPFMGVGNTALACRTLGIHYLGFETDVGYIACARESLGQR